MVTIKTRLSLRFIEMHCSKCRMYICLFRKEGEHCSHHRHPAQFEPNNKWYRQHLEYWIQENTLITYIYTHNAIIIIIIIITLQDYYRVSHWIVLPCILFIYTAFSSIYMPPVWSLTQWTH